MSTPLPPEPPTRRIEPVAAPPAAYERVVEPGVPVATDPNVLYIRLEDAISSLRTALVFVGILAVIATGVAVYALTRDTGTSSGATGTDSARITRVNDRVTRLSRQVQSARAGAGGAAALTPRVDALSRSVTALRSQVSSTTAAPDATQAVQALSKRIDDLDQRVQSLSQTQTQTTTP